MTDIRISGPEYKVAAFRCEKSVIAEAEQRAELAGLKLSAVLRALLESYAQGEVSVEKTRLVIR